MVSGFNMNQVFARAGLGCFQLSHQESGDATVHVYMNELSEAMHLKMPLKVLTYRKR